MSVRSTPRNTTAPAQQTIDFRSEFVNSPAAIQARHEETMGTLISRLDQLQAKVSSQGDTPGIPQVQTVFKTKPLQASAGNHSDLHERVSALESVHEDALQVLGEKLGQVEKHLLDKQDADGLMHQIASKFTLLESRLQSQTALSDRIAKLESKISSHSDLHTRVNHLESKYPSSHDILSTRVNRLESQMQPDPEHDRLIARINAKLDMIEHTQRMKLASNSSSEDIAHSSVRLGAQAPSNNNRSSSSGEMAFLQDRIDRLTALRARYAKEEKELLG